MKQTLKSTLLAKLKATLNDCELAADNARLASTDEQSVAETQYDTLAIEASYLAEGHSRRVNDLKSSIEMIAKLNVNEKSNIVTMASLVTLYEGNDVVYFIAPSAAGYRLVIEGKQVVVITPKSPLGKALLGKEVGDEVYISLGNNIIDDEISTIE